MQQSTGKQAINKTSLETAIKKIKGRLREEKRAGEKRGQFGVFFTFDELEALSKIYSKEK